MKRLLLFSLLFYCITLISQNSQLSEGEWYKISAPQTGVYKITYSDLTSYGIDASSINPQHISLFGNHAGMLPESLDEPYYTDLSEIAIMVIGEDDGVMDPDDYILFYGQSPNTWTYNTETSNFEFSKNLYSDYTFYFLTIGNSDGKRIKLEESTTLEPNTFPEFYDAHDRIESDLVNPGKTGKEWLGKSFDENNTLAYNFIVKDTLYRQNRKMHLRLAANSTDSSSFSVFIDNELYQSPEIAPSSNFYSIYRAIDIELEFNSTNEDTEVKIVYNNPNDSSHAWVDYIDIEYRNSTYFDYYHQFAFCSKESIGDENVSAFNLFTFESDSIYIWNVTDPLNVRTEKTEYFDNRYHFTLQTPELLKFQAFNGEFFYTPEFVGQVQNQNLHGISDIDFLVVTHPNFVSSANELAKFHRENDNMIIEVVTTDQIYNEFSSGAQDITAIRNFVKYIYDSSYSHKIQYLLLMGDASYDYKDRIEGNTNFVPVMESQNSYNIVSSYSTDSYFGIINNEDGNIHKLPVGRIPVSTDSEATEYVNKIKSYSALNFGPWKNEFLSVGDNGDNNLHMQMENTLSDTIEKNDPYINTNKCYLDFFEIIENEEGFRCPEAEAIINETINDGVFYANLTGHGCAHWFSTEQVITLDNIDDWTNYNNLPIITMATSESAIFDNPDVTSLGEKMTKSTIGGAIAVLSTTRAIYASSNFMTNKTIVENLTNSNNEIVRIGDLLENTGISENDQKWVLLGDPALRIPFPENTVQTNTVNGIPVDELIDTIAPGDMLTLTGDIVDESGNIISDFDGTIWLKVYAPAHMKSTLGQLAPAKEYRIQDSILVTENTEVLNGNFEITVGLPAKYNQDYGDLKLSWYAASDVTDASGYFNGPVYGGNPNSITTNNELLNSVNVYPTVFDQSITIEINAEENSNLEYTIYNALGYQVVPISSIYSGLNQVNLNKLSAGMYIVIISDNDHSVKYRIFKK